MLEKLLKYTKAEYNQLNSKDWLEDESWDDLSHQALSQENMDKLWQEPNYDAEETFP